MYISALEWLNVLIWILFLQREIFCLHQNIPFLTKWQKCGTVRTWSDVRLYKWALKHNKGNTKVENVVPRSGGVPCVENYPRRKERLSMYRSVVVSMYWKPTRGCLNACRGMYVADEQDGQPMQGIQFCNSEYIDQFVLVEHRSIAHRTQRSTSNFGLHLPHGISRNRQYCASRQPWTHNRSVISVKIIIAKIAQYHAQSRFGCLWWLTGLRGDEVVHPIAPAAPPQSIN